MPKTFKRRTNNNFSRKNRSVSSSLSAFQKQITVVFLEMIMMVKLFHWKTHSYATHKATDELYASLNEHIDSFIEVLLGKTGSRIDLMSNRSIKLIDLNSQEQLKTGSEFTRILAPNLNKNHKKMTANEQDQLNFSLKIFNSEKVKCETLLLAGFPAVCAFSDCRFLAIKPKIEYCTLLHNIFQPAQMSRNI